MPTLKALSVRLKLKASWEEEVATIDIVHEVAIQKLSPFFSLPPLHSGPT